MLQIIRGLQGATRTDHVGFGTVRRVDLEGRGERHLLLQGDDGLIQVKEDPALTPVRRFTLEEPGAAPGTRLSGLTWVADPDGGSDLVFVKREAPGEPPTLHLMGGDGARLQSLVELPMTGLFPDAVATVDLDGDGDREVYVGLGAYRRRLLRLDPPVTPGGGWTVSNPYPALLVGNSDVVWLRVLDVEQDSRPELLIHAGPWSAYDLRLLGPVEGERRLALRWREKLGMVPGAALFDDTLVIAVAARANPHASSTDEASLRWLDWDGSELRQRARVDCPRPISGEIVLSNLTRVSFGDALPDGLALEISTVGPPRHTALWLLPDGQREGLLLDGVHLRGAAQLDEDSASELILSDPEDGERLWVLGAGSDPLIPGGTARWGAVSTPFAAPVDEGFEGHWQAAGDLLSMGLTADASRALEDLAELRKGAPVEARALLEAARLAEEVGAFSRAAALYLEAAGVDAGRAALDGALRALQADLDVAGALEVTHRILSSPGDIDPESRARAQEALARIEPLVASEQVLEPLPGGALGAGWEVSDPTLLRRVPGTGALQMDVSRGDSARAALPLHWAGGSLHLEVDLEIRRIEWSSGFAIVLEPAAPDAEDGGSLGIRVWTLGGGDYLSRMVAFELPIGGQFQSPWLPVENATARDRWRIRLTYLPALGRARCTVQGPDGELIYQHTGSIEGRFEGDQWRLVLGDTFRGQRGRGAWASSVRLRGLVLRGAHLVAADAADEPAHLLGNRHLSNGDPLRAIDAFRAARGEDLQTGPRARALLGEALALDQLGRRSEAVDRLRQVLTLAEDPGVPSVGDAGYDLDPVVRLVTDLARTRREAHLSLLGEALEPRDFARVLAWDILFRSEGVTADYAGTVQVAEQLLRVVEGAGERLGDEATALRRHALRAAGRASARLGLLGDARRYLEEVLRLIEAELEPPGWDGADVGDPREYGTPARSREQLAGVEVELAHIAAKYGQEKEALDHARRALSLTLDPSLIGDRLLSDPDFSAIGLPP